MFINKGIFLSAFPKFKNCILYLKCHDNEFVHYIYVNLNKGASINYITH